MGGGNFRILAILCFCIRKKIERRFWESKNIRTAIILFMDFLAWGTGSLAMSLFLISRSAFFIIIQMLKNNTYNIDEEGNVLLSNIIVLFGKIYLVHFYFIVCRLTY